jgi:hypothetical protein
MDIRLNDAVSTTMVIKHQTALDDECSSNLKAMDGKGVVAHFTPPSRHLPCRSEENRRNSH